MRLSHDEQGKVSPYVEFDLRHRRGGSPLPIRDAPSDQQSIPLLKHKRFSFWYGFLLRERSTLALCLLHDGIPPSPGFRSKPLRLLGSPAALCIGIRRSGVVKHLVDNAPLCIDKVLPGEEFFDSVKGVAK